MTRTVLSVAYPFAPVGPDAVGGAEQVLSHIDRALVQSGERSVVVACEGSSTAGLLVEIPKPPGAITEELRARTYQRMRSEIERALSQWPVDLVHMHGIDFYEYLPEGDVPVLVTLHLPLAWYPKAVFALRQPRVTLQCVSAAQQRSCPILDSLLPIVENGVPIDQLSTNPCRKRAFAVALGRICPEKGFHLALAAAAQAGMPLILAGQVFPYAAHQDYFQRELAPHLDRDRRYIGPVRFRRKRRLLSSARCLLVPSLVAETSSLVAMEALACGTPVVAFPSGALPDIIEPGKTGWLVANTDEMAEAIAQAATIDPEACRESARRRFSLGHMLAGYFSLYQTILDRHRPRVEIDHDTSRQAPSSSHTASQPEHAIRSESSLRVQELTDIHLLEELGPKWTALWRRCPSATPFQAPAWLLPWWRRFGQGQLRTLAFFQEDELIGLVPAYVAELSSDADRSWSLLGAGISDYLDALIDPAFLERIYPELRARLAGPGTGWDRIDFAPLRENAALLEACRSGVSGAEVAQQDTCPVLALPCDGGWRTAIPRHQHNNWRYYVRRAERIGSLQLEIASSSDWLAGLRILLRLHGACWNVRGGTGVLCDEAVQRFHMEAAEGLLRLGVLRLYVLRLNGQPIAALYGFFHRHRFYYYLSGFDPLWASLSPGTLIVGYALAEAIREEAEQFDFLRGREAYKYLWGAKDSPSYRLSVRVENRSQVRQPGWPSRADLLKRT